MERDDIIEYSLHNHHSEEEGVKIRKKIYFVTILLSLITLVEVVVGIYFGRAFVSEWAWETIKWFYIILTVVKAAYIVMVFMHLKDETRDFKQMLLVPYITFILYLIVVCLVEGFEFGLAMTH